MSPLECVDEIETTLTESGWQEEEPGIWRPDGIAAKPSGADVLATLLDQPPWLEPRLLYDATGSLLFEEISRQPEYYLTRTEQSLLDEHADRIVTAADSEFLVELGAGFSVKTRTLLSAQLKRFEHTIFAPIDVSLTALRSSRDSCRQAFPDLHFVGLHCDSERGLKALGDHRKLVLFLGSSLGNLPGSDLLGFFRSMRSGLLPGDTFLLGVDHVKSRQRIEAAYNDDAGVTESFIRNVLSHLNSVLEADFNSDDFDYRARYSASRQQVELQLVARRAVRVRCRRPEALIEWPARTRLLVEVSRKFDPDRLANQAACFDFGLRDRLTDDRDWFSLLLLERIQE